MQVALANSTYYRTKLAPGSVTRSRALLRVLNDHVGPFVEKKYLVGGVTTQVHSKQDRLDIEFRLRLAQQKVRKELDEEATTRAQQRLRRGEVEAKARSSLGAARDFSFEHVSRSDGTLTAWNASRLSSDRHALTMRS